MRKIKFGILGGGWRTDFYLRIAQALPDRFEVGGLWIRDEEKGKAIESKWGVKTYRGLDEFVRGNGDIRFAVVSLAAAAAPAYVAELAKRGIPVLAETPPALDVEGLTRLSETVGGLAQAQVQVAEQYAFQPMHAARIALARSGKLGEISHIQVSAAHGYHGISLIRRLLGIGFEDAEIRGERFLSPIVRGPDREGPPREEGVVESVQEIATLRFGKQMAVFDFTGDQYFSWIRKNRVLVRGYKGEISGEELRYLRDFRTPVYSELRRVDTGHGGNLEGYYHRGIFAEGEWVYENPFATGRLADDEIAVATCLDRMAGYVDGGAPFYTLAEACQDQYVSLMMKQAIETGAIVTTSRQAWADTYF